MFRKRDPDDAYLPLDRLRSKVKRGAVMFMLGALSVSLVFTPLGHASDWILLIMVASAGLFFAIFGAGVLVEGVLELRKYRKMLERNLRDAWDSKTKPAEYGPWKPGDP